MCQFLLKITRSSFCSMLLVLTNDHRSTARAHVQPQAAAARILLRACAASLTAKSGRDKPTRACAAPCCSGGVQHLKKSSTEPTAATGGLQSSHGAADYPQQKPYRAAAGSKMQPPPRTPAGYDRWSRTAVKKKKPRRKDL